MSDNSLHGNIKQIIADYMPMSQEKLATYAIDGVLPRMVIAPHNIEELSSIVRLANEHKLTVFPRGGGTKTDVGLPPENIDIILSLEYLNQIIEYAPADMTVAMQAGTRISDLQAHLDDQGQFLALDPPHLAACTIGGVLATNASGPLRWTYGTARDQVIGSKVVQADGTVVKAGGKVVKNVAGYDLNKMYVGSMGTLGILAEVTLKIQPKVETGQALMARFPSTAAVVDAALQLMDSNIMPTFLEMANPVPAVILARRAGGGLGDDGFPLIIGATGASETVAWQMAEAEKLCQHMGAVQVIPIQKELYKLTMELLQEFPTGQTVPRGMLPGIVCRASVIPEDIGRLYQLAEDRCQILGIGCAMISHFGNGALVFVFFHSQPFDGERLDTLAKVLQELTSMANELGGAFTVEHAPVELKARHTVWGAPRKDWTIMKMLKEKYDPNRILNPGRFVGGI